MDSLLPYIEVPNGGFCLRFLPAPRLLPTADAGDRETFPFRVYHDLDPFTRVLPAEVGADSGSLLTRIFFFFQRDHYRVGQVGGEALSAETARVAEAVRVRTNPGVADLWRNAFLHHTNRTGENGPIILSGQLSADSGFSAFRPLLYCSHMRVFFEIDCPDCGRKLNLCMDDSLLTRVNLPPFSTSLERYLYCPACAEFQSDSVFYHYSQSSKVNGAGREHAEDDQVCRAGYERRPEDVIDGHDNDLKSSAINHGCCTEGMPHDHDRPCQKVIRNRFQLVADYRRLISKGDPTGRHPCPKCAHSYECYGPNQMAAERISPFSFYPFYALVFSELRRSVSRWPPLIEGLPPEVPTEDEIRTEADQHLRLEAVPEGSVRLDVRVENEALERILDRIFVKWSRAAGGERKERGRDERFREPLEDISGEETLPLPMGRSAAIRSRSREAGQDPGLREAGEQKDTLLILRDEDRVDDVSRLGRLDQKRFEGGANLMERMGRTEFDAGLDRPSLEDEDFEATRTLRSDSQTVRAPGPDSEESRMPRSGSREGRKVSQSPSEGKPPEDDGKTIILGAGEDRSWTAPFQGGEAQPGVEAEEHADPGSASRRQEAAHHQDAGRGGGDVLPETVILGADREPDSETGDKWTGTDKQPGDSVRGPDDVVGEPGGTTGEPHGRGGDPDAMDGKPGSEKVSADWLVDTVRLPKRATEDGTVGGDEDDSEQEPTSGRTDTTDTDSSRDLEETAAPVTQAMEAPSESEDLFLEETVVLDRSSEPTEEQRKKLDRISELVETRILSESDKKRQ